MITAPGLHPQITPTEYFAEPCPAPALTNSIITKLIHETPADAAYHHVALNPDRKDPDDSAAKRLGDVTHQLALGKGKGYVIGDFHDFRTKAAQQWRDDVMALGKTPVLAVKFADAERMADILCLRIEAELDAIAKERGVSSPLGYETEVVFAWQEETAHGPIWCRGMLDLWCPSLGVALDLKVTDRLIERRIRPHMENMGWDQQAVWYERGLSRIAPDMAGRITFGDLMVRPKPPHSYRLVGMTEAWRSAIEPTLDQAVEMWGRCLALNDWPGYPHGLERLEPTSWRLRTAMEAELAAEMEDEEVA